jgi:hypothetical protein
MCTGEDGAQYRSLVHQCLTRGGNTALLTAFLAIKVRRGRASAPRRAALHWTALHTPLPRLIGAHRTALTP